MKRIFAFALIVFFAVGILPGCGNKSKKEPDTKVMYEERKRMNERTL